MKKQEYLYNSEYVTIADEFDHGDALVIVVNDHEEYLVARRESLQRKEDSWGFKRAEERRKELEDITKKAEVNLDKLTDKLVDKALIALSSRLKFNALFGEDQGTATTNWVFTIADELKKLVKEKAPETIKDKIDF